MHHFHFHFVYSTNALMDGIRKWSAFGSGRHQFLFKPFKEDDTDYGRYIKQNFLPHMDDCFIKWPTKKWHIETFLVQLVKLHPDITFTHESNDMNTHFLDIRIILRDSTITDIHQYLDVNSCHPRHTKRRIIYIYIYAQAHRICTNIDDAMHGS